MKNAVLLFVAVLMAALSAQAQDIIITKKSDRIDAKILKVTETEVEYKKVSNPDGPTFTIATTNISSILYANGEAQSFENVAEEENAHGGGKGGQGATFTSSSIKNRLYKGLEFSAGALLSVYLGEGGGTSINADMGLGRRFSDRLYFGFNLGLSVSSGEVNWGLGSNLRVYHPISHSADAFLDIYGGTGCGKNGVSGFNLKIMPGVQFPLSSKVDFRLGVGYLGGWVGGYSSSSLGFEAAFAFHRSTSAIRLPEESSVKERGFTLSIEAKVNKPVNFVEESGEDHIYTGLHPTLVLSYKTGRYFSIGLGASYPLPTSGGGYIRVEDFEDGGLEYSEKRQFRTFLRGHYRILDAAWSPFVSVDAGLMKLYDDPFLYATPAAGVSFKAGSSTFFDMKIGYEIAHANDVYILNGWRFERGSFTLKTINFSWGVTFKL